MTIGVLIIIISLIILGLVWTLWAQAKHDRLQQERNEPYVKPKHQQVPYLQGGADSGAVDSFLTAESAVSSSSSQDAGEDAEMVEDPDAVLGLVPPEPITSNETDDMHAASLSDMPMKREIILFISAEQDRPYAGYELMQTILSSDMRYGDHSIFYRYENKMAKGKVLFSLASAVAPGTFDLPNMGGFSTPALVLYLDLAKVSNRKEVFELMMGVADNITADLGGVVLDENKEKLTRESLRELFIQIRRYDSGTRNLDLFSRAELDSSV